MVLFEASRYVKRFDGQDRLGECDDLQLYFTTMINKLIYNNHSIKLSLILIILKRVGIGETDLNL
jgi:hypothetical protein